MMKKLIVSTLILLCFSAIRAQDDSTFDFDISQLEIKYEKFTLPNGLTVIVHEDHKAPIVAVNVWYHVGSKNEPEGKSGFAHLFEHLMFNGSENFDDDYFQAMDRIGATDLNGTTWFDRTNYFQNVPKSALDVALFMESDRMGHFLGVIDSARLDEQRDVVKNEKRQSENQPYGQTWNYFTERCFPKGHPYNHTVIGSMDDLSAASLQDVKDWFTQYYGAANAVVVIAGDVSTDEAYNKALDYFGDIPSGPPIAHAQDWVAKRTAEVRDILQDRVPQIRLEMIWNVPGWGSEESINLDIAARVLAQGKNSRLYKRLVYDEQIVTNINCSVFEMELASLFNVELNVKPGESKEEVERIFQEEFERFLKEGPTAQELKRVKTQYFAQFTRGIERIGGFGGKSDILASNMVYGGSPDFYMKRLKAFKEATPEEVRKEAEEWLSDGRYVLEIVPFNEYTTVASGVDRSKFPQVGPADDVAFPAIERATLSNGMNIMLARRSTVPLIEMRMVFDAGYAADQNVHAGTANLMMNMLDEGTKSRSALQINEELALLGANLNTGSNLDNSYVTLSSLKDNFDPSLEVFADVVLNPSFPEEDFERLKKQQIVGIQSEKKSPVSMALRTLPKFLYGDGHAYGNPLTGSGYEATVEKIQRNDLVEFYNSWIKPNNSTIVAVGDISMDELKNKLEKYFKKWKRGEVPNKNLELVGSPNKKKIYLMDRPGSQQSVIISGHLTQPYGEPNEIALDMMNKIVGGEFTARVNMNLREEKGWAYGAYTFISNAKGQRPYLAYAPVQTDQTAASMKEIMSELTGYIGDNPATNEEFEKVRKNEILSLPGQWETMNAVEASMANIVRYGLTDDYYQKYTTEVRSLTLDDIHSTANQIIEPSKITWLVVGDGEKIIESMKELGYGEVILIDSEGNVLSPESQKIKIEGK